MKKIFITLLFITLPISLAINFLTVDKTFAKHTIANKITTEVKSYTYVRVFVDGKWWIYVYDEDGRLIDVYPDTNE